MNARNPLYYLDARYFADCLLLCTKDFGMFVGGKDVVYICSHNAQGAFGFVLSRRYSLTDSAKYIDAMRKELRVDERIAERWWDEPSFPRYVHWGGPKESDTAIYFHRRNTYVDTGATISFEHGVSITSTQSAIENFIMNDCGAEESKLMLGHLSYGPNGLNREIGQGLWVPYKASDTLLFKTDTKKIASQLKKIRPIYGFDRKPE